MTDRKPIDELQPITEHTEIPHEVMREIGFELTYFNNKVAYILEIDRYDSVRVESNEDGLLVIELNKLGLACENPHGIDELRAGDRLVFELGRPLQIVRGMGFDQAIKALKRGDGVRRVGWNGTGLTVFGQFPDADSKMSLPYLYIEYPDDAKTTPGARCPWVPSATDLMAEDWEVVA
ncbi:DUF2829 domain-containing protein [Aeromonas veronii]|uniref:DUF2829 domain-containing protein n=1 Tax=Aeromonas veronii TaxID=654 RepID=UPI003F74A309